MVPVAEKENAIEIMLLPQEVAEKLRIGLSSVYHMAARGVIPGVKIGGRLRFRASTINKHIANLEKVGYGKAA